MAFVASLLALHVAISAAAANSGGYHGEAPVRRQLPAHGDQPMTLKVAADDEESKEESKVTVNATEFYELSVSALHKDWPHCQKVDGRNWQTSGKGAEQHLAKINVNSDVASAQLCGEMCGSYHGMHGDVMVPCAGWAYVEKTWAKEFHGHKACAMFGFVQNEKGVVRAPVGELTFKNHCCSAGTPCQKGEILADYSLAADRVASAWHIAERTKANIAIGGATGQERIVTARAKVETYRAGHSWEHWLVVSLYWGAMAVVLAGAIIAGVCAYKAVRENK